MNRRQFLAANAAAAMGANTKYKVAIIGCGRMGQYYAEVYRALPDTEIVAIAEWNADRRRVVGERFGVKALYPDAPALLKDVVPDLAAIITPTKFMKDAVIACAQAGVKGITTDKPIAARLSDADAMVEACAKRGIVFGGGNLQRALPQVQEVARRLHAGEWGRLRGAAIHRYGGEISGGGCQHVSVLRLLAKAEVTEVMAFGSPPEALAKENDVDLVINGVFRLSNGIDCQVFGGATPSQGADVWTDHAMIRWDWAPPRVFSGVDHKGARVEIDPKYQPYPWKSIIAKANGLRDSDLYLVSSIRSFIDAVRSGSELWISGHDLRQALEVAIACKLSAKLGAASVRLPLSDRSLTLYPSPYRWLGGDAIDKPQTPDEAAGKKL